MSKELVGSFCSHTESLSEEKSLTTASQSSEAILLNYSPMGNAIKKQDCIVRCIKENCASILQIPKTNSLSQAKFTSRHIYWVGQKVHLGFSVRWA